MKKSSGDKAPQTLAMGYEVLEVKEDGDEGASSSAVAGIILGRAARNDNADVDDGYRLCAPCIDILPTFVT